MLTVLVLNILAVFFAYLARYKQFKHGLKISFLLIFIFLALRYDYGNDYKSYLNIFNDLNQNKSFSFFKESGRFELGWVLLCRIFRPFGFFSMIAFLALFNSLIYYNFIKKYTPVKYYWIAVFIYVFGTNFMLVHSTAMRQSVAIAIFIFSFDYLFQRKAIPYFLCIGIASLFHSSALVLLPVYLLTTFNFKISKFTGVILYSIFIFLFLFSKQIFTNFAVIVNLYFSKYEYYLETKVDTTFVRIVFYSILFLLIIYFQKYQDDKFRILFNLSIIGLYMTSLASVLMMISRIGMYFDIATIVTFPIIISNIKNKYLRVLIASFIITFTLYRFNLFFQSDIWRDGFKTYQTIFSSPNFY